MASFSYSRDVGSSSVLWEPELCRVEYRPLHAVPQALELPYDGVEERPTCVGDQTRDVFQHKNERPALGDGADSCVEELPTRVPEPLSPPCCRAALARRQRSMVAEA